MSLSRRTIATALAGSLSCAAVLAPAYAENLFFDSELSFAHEDNVGRAAQAGDTVDDDIAIARAAATWLRPLTSTAGMLAAIAVEYQRFNDLSDLSHWQLGGTLTYRYKPAPQFDAPWYEFEATGALREFAASDIRNGGRISAGAAIGRDLTERIQFRLGYRYAAERAWHQAVFDDDQHRLYVSGEWHVARLTWYSTVGWQTGDTVSSATDNARLEAAASADAPDSALSRGAHPLVAYRVNADTITTAVGINYAPRPNVAVDVSALYFDAGSATGAHYVGYRVTAGILCRF